MRAPVEPSIPTPEGHTLRDLAAGAVLAAPYAAMTGTFKPFLWSTGAAMAKRGADLADVAAQRMMLSPRGQGVAFLRDIGRLRPTVLAAPGAVLGAGGTLVSPP